MSSDAKINIFCPIETINRELDFRLFLAAHCIRPGMRFIIGKRNPIGNLVNEMKDGMYVGQVRPMRHAAANAKPEKRLNDLRASGTTLVIVDEEGGIMAGDEERWKEWLDFRLDVTQLESQEHLCTWGDFQREYYSSLDTPASEHIVTTGHPRFDLYKASHREYYRDEVEHWKNKFGDFVLINTNFAISNHSQGEKYLFDAHSYYSYYDPTDDAKKLDFFREWNYKTTVRANMITLVARLSIEMPQLNIVIRPHPSENMQSYEAIFQKMPNVYVEHEGSVGPWLMASRALIHDGCTTALEAHFSGVPILNYKSLHEERYDLMLPNSLGLTCETEDRVLESVQAILGGDTSVGHAKEVPAMAKDLIDNFEHDSFAAMTNYLHRVAECVRPTPASYDRVLRKYQNAERIKPMARSLKMKLRPHDKTITDKFYGFEHLDMPAKFQKVQQTLNKDLRFTMLSNRVFTVEC